ncbi:hypothetical protein OSB04_019242 [Centaurea solstitialis]|uniref:Uncharacterized protein n=1 Tax=Centaurea solstitialis TaxID=347529 RepID=A0AA38SRK4_9ASTR|nr:hypothetical protein OSB04_019242 [Centaurea solstitialis]
MAERMHFLLTTLKVVYMLSTPILEVMENETLEVTGRQGKWENDDYICRDHILSVCVESSKELWDYLESKYMVEDASGKRKFNEVKKSANKKVKLTCWTCGMIDHLKRDFGVSKNKNGANSSKVGKDPRIKTHDKEDGVAWWIDSGAISDVCKDRRWFISLKNFHLGLFILNNAIIQTE